MPEPSGVRQGELICHGVPERAHQSTPQYSANEAEQKDVSASDIQPSPAVVKVTTLNSHCPHLTLFPSTSVNKCSCEIEEHFFCILCRSVQCLSNYCVFVLQWLRGVIALQCSVMRHLSAKQMSSSNGDSRQSQQADVKPCVEAKEHGSHSPTHRTHSPSLCSKPCSAHVGPQGAPVLHKPQAPSEQLDRCSTSSEKPCQDCRPLNGLLEGRSKANGPVVLEAEQGDHKPSKLSSPSVPELSLPNHVKTDKVKIEESSHLLSSCAQKESPWPGSSGGELAGLGSGRVSSSVVNRLASPLPPSGMAPLSTNLPE